MTTLMPFFMVTDPIDEFDDLPDDAPLPGTAEPDQPDPGNAPIREVTDEGEPQ